MLKALSQKLIVQCLKVKKCIYYFLNRPWAWAFTAKPKMWGFGVKVEGIHRYTSHQSIRYPSHQSIRYTSHQSIRLLNYDKRLFFFIEKLRQLTHVVGTLSHKGIARRALPASGVKGVDGGE